MSMLNGIATHQDRAGALLVADAAAHAARAPLAPLTHLAVVGLRQRWA